MKKSISYWAFPGGLTNTAPYDGVFRAAKAAGYRAVEVSVGAEGALHLNSSDAEISRIRGLARETGVEIAGTATGLYWGATFSDPSASKRAQAKAQTLRMLEIASKLGTDSLLVVPGSVDVFFDPKSPVVPYDECYRRARTGLMSCAKTAEKLKVSMNVEVVWNRFLYSPMEARQFLDSVGSRWVGLYFDTGNVTNFSFAEHWIPILGRRIRRVHFKDFQRAVGNLKGFCDLGAGDVNWKAVMAGLRKIRYKSYLTAEMIPFEPATSVREDGVIERTSQAMDRILSGKM